jgi:hypothetical protein
MPGAGLFESLPSLHDPAALAEVAHRTATVLVRGAQNSDDEKVAERVMKLADDYGLDQLADLWSDSPADSYAETVAREYAAGRQHAEVHAVVAGVADPPGPTEVRDMVDAVLRGVADGDFATTLDRASAFARIVATGRAYLADEGHEQIRSASRLVEMADQLQSASRAERAGNLW